MAGPCDVWILAGQSNMRGRGDSSLSPTVEVGAGYEWRSGGLVHLEDPVASNSSVHNAQTGCMAPAFVNAFTSVSERPSIVVPCAAGGSGLLPGTREQNVNSWEDGGNRYNTCISRAEQALLDLDNDGWTPAEVHVLWHQGEADAESYPSPDTLEADYTAGMIDLLGRFRSDLSLASLNIYVWRLGNKVARADDYAKVRAAQDAACETDGLVMAYTRCVDFAALGWMQPDDTHYTQPGYNDMGTLGAAVVAADIGFDPPPIPTVPLYFPTTANLMMYAV